MENKEKSIISTIFTDEQLKELNFTPEEIEAIEDAETISQANDLFPDTEEGIDEFFKKLDNTFPANAKMEDNFQKYLDLSKTDPKFLEQIVSYSALMDFVTEIPEPKVEKLDIAEILKEKGIQADEEKVKKFAEIDRVLGAISKDNK